MSTPRTYGDTCDECKKKFSDRYNIFTCKLCKKTFCGGCTCSQECDEDNCPGWDCCVRCFQKHVVVEPGQPKFPCQFSLCTASPDQPASPSDVTFEAEVKPNFEPSEGPDAVEFYHQKFLDKKQDCKVYKRRISNLKEDLNRWKSRANNALMEVELLAKDLADEKAKNNRLKDFKRKTLKWIELEEKHADDVFEFAENIRKKHKM